MSVIPSLSGFIFTDQLGKGSYATVYKAYRKGNNREVAAIKCVNKSSLTKSSVENLLTEIKILKKVKHENIVDLKDFQWDENYIYLILEYCSGKDLSHFIRSKKRLPESVAQKFLQQLAKALQVLRAHNISHMDLKPQNILLSDFKNPILKLGDFGLAQYIHSDSEASSLRGSPLYMAPEILLKHHYDARVDLWSVGIILYECLFGQAPFSSQTFSELTEKIKSPNPIEIPYGAQVSDNCRHLILNLLQRDPNKRMTFEEFFNHPFVDLEHMPTTESYAKGVQLVHEAVEADNKKQYEEAITFYKQALDYLAPHITCQKEPSKRKELRTKLLEYVSRVEILQSLNTSNVASTSNSSKSETSDTNIDDLIKDNPALKQAFYLAAKADDLVKKKAYIAAIDHYQQSLEILVPLSTVEPKGPLKDFLYAEADKLLKKAENLKSSRATLRQRNRNKIIDALKLDQNGGTNQDKSCSMQ